MDKNIINIVYRVLHQSSKKNIIRSYHNTFQAKFNDNVFTSIITIEHNIPVFNFRTYLLNKWSYTYIGHYYNIFRITNYKIPKNY